MATRRNVGKNADTARAEVCAYAGPEADAARQEARATSGRFVPPVCRMQKLQMSARVPTRHAESVHHAGPRRFKHCPIQTPKRDWQT